MLALKEWSAAVHALLDGRQCVLLRKGGIGEKRFEVRGEQFLLFPTVAHGHAERVRPEHRALLAAAAADSTDERVTVRAAARVHAAVAVERPDGLPGLADTHIWTDASVHADRLDFRPRHRLTVLVVSVRPLVAPIVVRRAPSHGGCVSWLDLAGCADLPTGAAVRDDADLDAVAERVRTAVG